jgi:AraC-like DNA-binding protein
MGAHAEQRDRHAQDFDEIALAQAGTGVLWVSGVQHRFDQGAVCVIRPGEEHAFKSVRGLEVRSVLFDGQRALTPRVETLRLPGYHGLFLQEPHHRKLNEPRMMVHLSGSQVRYFLDLMQRLESEEEVRTPGYETMMQVLFMQIVVYLARVASHQAETPALQRNVGLASVVHYMEVNYTQPVRLDELAAHARMSKNNLLRAFKKQYKVSPIEYLIRLRMTRACEQMREPDRTVSEIAYDVGFSDSNYFSRRFRETYGVPPSIYRKRVGQG